MGRLTPKDWENQSNEIWLKLGYIQMSDEPFRTFLSESLQKLAHYEDLEEQGRLIELPCAVGDTVYMIQKRYTKCSKYQECRDEYNCQGCEELGCDSHIEHYISSLNSAPIDWIVTMENQFGKTVFLTKEEAEAKLAELKGE